MWYTATWNRYAPTRFVLFRSHSLWKPSKSTQSILCIVLFIDCKLKNVISYRGNGKFTIHFIYCFLRAHKCVCVRCFFCSFHSLCLVDLLLYEKAIWFVVKWWWSHCITNVLRVNIIIAWKTWYQANEYIRPKPINNDKEDRKETQLCDLWNIFKCIEIKIIFSLSSSFWLHSGFWMS